MNGVKKIFLFWMVSFLSLGALAADLNTQEQYLSH